MIVLAIIGYAHSAANERSMRRAKNQEPLDFTDAIKRHREQVIEDFSLNAHRYAYVDRGLYTAQIERVFQFFPREQVFIIKYENFRKDYAATIAAVFDFLGVRPLPGLKNKERNTGPY